MQILSHKPLGEQWEVQGEAGTYEISLQSNSRWHCNCPSFKFNSNPCKHIKELATQIKSGIKKEMGEIVDQASSSFTDSESIRRLLPSRYKEYCKLESRWILFEDLQV